MLNTQVNSALSSRAVSLQKMWMLHDECVKIGVKYGLGDKAPSLGALTGSFSRIDCSGYVRWLLYRASDGRFVMPDGSWNQRAWCEAQGFPQINYEAMDTPQRNRLFIAFITAHRNGAGSVGHVWLLAERNGVMATLESYGGKGVGSLPWINKTRRSQVHKCFELPAAPSALMESTPAAARIPIPEYSGPAFEVVANGANIGPGLIYDNELYVPARALLQQIGHDIVKSGDYRARREQPRFYIVTGKRAA